MKCFDLVIVGGGINGAACAAEASMRGLSVLLCEQDDLASKTSSKSSKLIHGGLRYLESYDFGLVKKSLDEQQILLSIAPHIVHPLPLILPHTSKHRPMWLLRLGLWIYDHLSKINKLPNSKRVFRSKNLQYFSALHKHINKGFIFYDCNVDDARLTIINALQAKKYGAEVNNYTKLIHAKLSQNYWQLTLQNQQGISYSVQSRALINATGPWLQQFSQIIQQPLKYSLRLVKGSHIVVPRLYDGEHAYLLQNDDKRIIFVMPFHGYSMIGTTEIPYQDHASEVQIQPEEIDYLCGIAHKYFKQTLYESSIIYSWSGIRPLINHTNQHSSQLSREHAIDFTQHPAPLITIYGGKITTHRQVAVDAISQLQAIFPNLTPSKITPLPGATLGNLSFVEYQKNANQYYSWLPKNILHHYLTTYGTLTEKILANCQNLNDLGKKFNSILYQREVDYLIQEEWALTVDDIIWRRTKLGLQLEQTEKEQLAQYIKEIM
jgi:glycerol-3-phosphate dehydrogenase